jgi:hypothetical protein
MIFIGIQSTPTLNNESPDSDRPDMVVIFGNADGTDDQIIERDCRTWQARWESAGVPTSAIHIKYGLKNRSELHEFLVEAGKSLSAPIGKMWLCVSGHGFVVNHEPTINLLSSPTEFDRVPWKSVFTDLNLPDGWNGTVIADLCHNNMLRKDLPKNFQAIVWDVPEDQESCLVASYNFGKNGNRGIISWAACQSLRYRSNLYEMAQKMSAFCQWKPLVESGKNYHFRVEHG